MEGEKERESGRERRRERERERESETYGEMEKNACMLAASLAACLWTTS